MNNNEAITLLQDAADRADAFLELAQLAPTDARAIARLLKEQEPLEPTMVEIEQAGPLYHRCYCPKCGHHVGNRIQNKVTDVHENFCSSCGQEIKWE